MSASSRVIQFWSGQVITADGQNSQSFATGRYNTAEVYLEVTAKGGTTPTLDLDVETSPDNSSWFKDSDITQINDPTVTFNAPVHTVNEVGKFLRVGLPTGAVSSGASFTINGWLVLKST